MIEKYRFCGEDFKTLMQFEGWKIGFLRYSERFSKLSELERHLMSSEAFVLLEGSAILYTGNETCKMERCVLYNIPQGEWHHITVSGDATVMVVENSNTSRENTEKRNI